MGTEEFNRAVKAGSQLVAVGSDGPHSLIYTSPTGASWTKSSTVPSTATTALRGVASSLTGGLVVAVGDAATIVVSTDYGTTWAKQAVPKGFPASENFTDITFANNLFIAVTHKGGIWTSPNGSTWLSRRASSPVGFNRVMVAGNQFIALGDSGFYAWSFNGTIWSNGDIGTAQNMTDAAFNGTTLVAVGEIGAIWKSSGGQPGRPTVSFGLASSSVKEDAGTTNITLNLTPASIAPVTVLFTIGGTATSGSDYIITLPSPPVGTPKPPANTVVFAAGETNKTIQVAIKKDTVDEPDSETLVLSLGTPTGEAVLGAPKVHTLTIGDLFPTFTTHPVDQLVVAGTSPTLSATAVGSAMLGTWKKNGGASTAIALPSTASSTTQGPVAYTGTLTNVQTTHAGAYTLAIASPSGAKVSNIGQVGVVVNNPTALGAAVDSTVTLTAIALGNGLSYQWLRDGVEIHNSTDLRITGTNALKLIIKSVDPADSGVYACRVTMTTPTGTLTQNAGTTTLAVATSVPLVTTTGALPPTTVGQPYNFTLAANDVVSGWVDINRDLTGTTTSTGLKLDPITGQIYGKATASGSFSFTVAAKNAIGTGPGQIVTLQIAPLPANSVGNYSALIDRSPTANQNLGGYLRITVAASGTLTGTLTEGGINTNLSGPLTYVPGAPATLTASIPISPDTPASPVGTPAWPILPAVTLNLTITPSTNIFIGSIVAGATTVNFTGTPEGRWASTSVPVDKRGLFTFIIQPPATAPSQALTDIKKPLGYGFGKFTVPANGVIVLAGQTADGASYTRSGVMAADETIMFYSGNFATLSSMHGRLSMTVSGSAVFTDTDVTPTPTTTKEVQITGNLTWLRGAEPTPTSSAQLFTEMARQRIYRDGFKDGVGNIVPLTYTADGGHFFKQPNLRTTAPTSTGILLNLPSTPNNSNLSFLYGSLADNSARLATNDPDVLMTISAPAVAAVVLPAGNPAGVELVTGLEMDTFNTGLFRGSFAISDTVNTKVIPRLADFRGIVIRQANSGFSAIAQRGFGYFLLPKLPESGAGPNGTTSDAAKNSPILSGQVKLTQ